MNYKKQGFFYLFLFLIIFFTMTACSNTSEDVEGTKDQLSSAESIENETIWTLGTFPIASPESQGMDSIKLNEMFDKIQKYKYDIHHILVIRNGYAVTSCDFYPHTADNLHILNSVTKSVTSFAIGKAKDEGLIPSVQRPVLSFFKDQEVKNQSDFKSQLTLKHLLTMSAGLEWSEDGNYGASYDSYTLMSRSENPMMYVLNRPVITMPGTSFYYNTGLSYLLSGIITQVTGISESDYVDKVLFKPLGINQYSWWTDPQGITSGGSALLLTTEDLAKFGYLYLNQGKWNGKQLISKEWITESTAKQIDTPKGLAGRDGYGYQWWMNSFDGYSARGYRGQYLFVCPEENIVVVFYSGLSGSNFYVPEQLMRDFILPSIQASLPIDENAQALKALNDSIVAFEKTPEKQAVSVIPDTFKALEGEVFDTAEGSISLSLNADIEGADEIMLHWLANGDQYDVPVGLDGVYRISTCSNFMMNGLESPVGFKGIWLNDTTLSIDVLPLEGDALYRLTLTYRDGQLTSKFDLY